MLVNVCVCTYCRPEMLRNCLVSLREMEKPDAADVRITVIDNDKESSAWPVFKEIFGSKLDKYHYKVEDKQGIPCARNCALEVSLFIGADVVVFIDDDERAERKWLVELLNVSKKYGHRSAIHGAVIPCPLEETPDDLRCFFRPKYRPEGSCLSACATDNVLIPMSFVKATGLRFDEQNPLAGGTDTIFFTRASDMGLQIVQTNSAIVYEDIAASRLTLNWIVRRKFRAGVTDAWRRQHRGQRRELIVVKSVFHVIRYVLVVIFYQLTGRSCYRNKGLAGLAKYAGIFMGCFGWHVDSYGKIDS